MAWTTPKTWSSEPLTSNDLNTYVRDNQTYLYNRLENNNQYRVDEDSDYTTTSNLFVDVDDTNLALTITTNGGDVLCGFAGCVTVNSNLEIAFFDVDVDGVRVGGDDGIMSAETGVSNQRINVSFVTLITGLAAGSHSFKLQWKYWTGNTLTMYAGAGSTRGDFHPQFWVQEL